MAGLHPADRRTHVPNRLDQPFRPKWFWLLDTPPLDGHAPHAILAQSGRDDLAGPAYEDSDLVFCDELGGVIQPKWLTGRFRTLRAAAGITTGSLHILRNTR